MTWTNRDGQPLSLEAVFAAQLGDVKRRLGGDLSRHVQRAHRRAAVEETTVLIVRTADGTRVFRGQEAP